MITFILTTKRLLEVLMKNVSFEKVKKERLLFERRVTYDETFIRYQTDVVGHFGVKSR